ncbi:hypothetical protein [Blastococcus sp. SYSU DS0973]
MTWLIAPVKAAEEQLIAVSQRDPVGYAGPLCRGQARLRVNAPRLQTADVVVEKRVTGLLHE